MEKLRSLLRPTITPAHASALKACECGDAAEAIRLFESVPPDAPGYLLALGGIADLYVRLGRWVDAERVAREVVRLGTLTTDLQPPRFISAARNHAEAVAVQGRDAEASAFFHRAERLAVQFLDEAGDDLPDLTEWYALERAAVLVSWANTALHMRNIEIACEMLREAHAVCNRAKMTRPDELADCLAHLGEALMVGGQPTEAELALCEALDIVTRVSDEPHCVYVLGILGRLGSDRFVVENGYARIVAFAEKSEAGGRFAAAHVQWCICAEIARRAGDNTGAVAAIERARMLEPRLKGMDLNPAKLRIDHARLLQDNGATCDKIVVPLLEGARLWFELLARPLLHRDVVGMAFEMHETFRLLARKLLDCGRTVDSLIAFEAGRALGHCTQVDPSYRARVISQNPFSPNGTVDNRALSEIQLTLAADEALVSIAVLPPDVVAYVLGRDGVSIVSVHIPSDESQRRVFATALEAIPTRLRERVGARAIPTILRELGSKIAESVGTRLLTAILPYAALHNVPWRVVLRDAGLPWSQLLARTEFGLFLRSRDQRHTPSSALALGFGKAGELDLSEEAKTFAEKFGAHGKLRSPCNSDDVTQALKTEAIVLISCHGDVDSPQRVRDNLDDGELILHLHDGAHRAKGVIPAGTRSPLVILSACESGVYRMTHGDFPAGAAPDLLRAGVRECIGARFRLGVSFAASFMPALGEQLAARIPAARAFALVNASHEPHFDLWRDLACLELLG